MTASPSAPARATVRNWTAAQRFAFLFGAVYFVVGLAGFALTGFSGFAGHQHHTLLIFAVNPLHNLVHLVVALVWLAAAPRERTARAANLALGVVLGLVTVLGFVNGMGMLGMSGLSDPDNFLHLATATLSLYFGSLAAGQPADRQPQPPDRADREPSARRDHQRDHDGAPGRR